MFKKMGVILCLMAGIGLICIPSILIADEGVASILLAGNGNGGTGDNGGNGPGDGTGNGGVGPGDGTGNGPGDCSIMDAHSTILLAGNGNGNGGTGDNGGNGPGDGTGNGGVGPGDGTGNGAPDGAGDCSNG